MDKTAECATSWRGAAGVLALATLVPLAPADGAVVISSQPTEHMNCSGGLCAPTAKNAIVNTSDLEAMLASGDIEIATTGSGVEAHDILVRAAFGWPGDSRLTLDAHNAIAIRAPVSVAGAGALSLLTRGKSGALSFIAGGKLTFANPSSLLSIDGAAYTLETSVATLAAAIAANPDGNYALAGSYDAKGDGTYAKAPIAAAFTGAFEGLGNAILNLSVDDEANAGDDVGLFAFIDTGGSARDVGLVGTNVTGDSTTTLGALAGANSGTITGSYATGMAAAGQPNAIGGLVGANEGIIENSWVTISVAGVHDAGGLAGVSSGSISRSWASGAVNQGTFAGGLVGSHGIGGAITDSYATGTVTNGTFGGGLVGYNQGADVFSSYSTGAAVGGSSEGGFAGFDDHTLKFKSCYWDTSTSGTDKATGNKSNDPGISGLTTRQWKSGLPPGLSPKIWAEDRKINGGLPYIRAVPPQ